MSTFSCLGNRHASYIQITDSQVQEASTLGSVGFRDEECQFGRERYSSRMT